MVINFNIGLDDLPRIIQALPTRDFTITRLHRYSGEYLGNWENGYSFSAIVELYSHDMVADIAEKLGQECIAIYYPNFFQGEIIYSRLFTGERITFDPKYFHMPFINENVGRILTLYHGTCEGMVKTMPTNVAVFQLKPERITVQ